MRHFIKTPLVLVAAHTAVVLFIAMVAPRTAEPGVLWEYVLGIINLPISSIFDFHVPSAVRLHGNLAYAAYFGVIGIVQWALVGTAFSLLQRWQHNKPSHRTILSVLLCLTPLYATLLVVLAGWLLSTGREDDICLTFAMYIPALLALLALVLRRWVLFIYCAVTTVCTFLFW